MPVTTRITQHSGNQIPEQHETPVSEVHEPLARKHAPLDDVTPGHPTVGLTSKTPAQVRACRAPEQGGRRHAINGARGALTGSETPRASQGEPSELAPEHDRPLVDAMSFFETPDAQPRLPYEQMIYTSMDKTYTFRSFPQLPVIPNSVKDPYRAVQLNLTHDGALGAALVTLASDPHAFAQVIRPANRPGHYIVTLRLPSQFGGTLTISNVLDARVPADQDGRVLGWAGPGSCSVLWPLVVAKAIGKLFGVLVATGHISQQALAAGGGLSYAQYSTWLRGRAPAAVTSLDEALANLRDAGKAFALKTPNPALVRAPLIGGQLTSELAGMATRLRSDDGDIDALLLDGHHYGVVAADAHSVTLYNPLGFNPHPHLADAKAAAFFNPHTLADAEKTAATLTLPLAWLKAMGCAWFA